MKWPDLKAKLSDLFVLLYVAVALVLMAIFAPFYGGYRLGLRAVIEARWGRHGKRILLIYSRSPNWQEYIEVNWLPKIGDHAVVLNLSDCIQRTGDEALAARAFTHWSPEKNFKPMVILFPRFGWVRRIGFFYAFRDHKHGNEDRLRESETELFAFAEQL